MGLIPTAASKYEDTQDDSSTCLNLVTTEHDSSRFNP